MILYTVRSRFTDPAREDAWNEWYAGHLDVLMRVPGFLAAQRFHSTETVDERPYLAMYAVESADVFGTDAYVSVWGFNEWRPYVDNWTRDLFELRHGDGIDFATPPGGRLRAAFVNGDARALDELAAGRPGLRAAEVAGLDESCQGVAWEVGESEPLPEPAGASIAQALYRPISECRR